MDTPEDVEDLDLELGDEDEAPSWHGPKGLKSEFDFPRARRGKTDRFEFEIGTLKPGSPKRLDKYLCFRFTGYSRSFLQKMIKDGKVLVNSQPVKANGRVKDGDQITILLPEAHQHAAEDIPFAVLYRDEAILALSKPSGIVVHPARGNLSGTLLNGLLHYFREELDQDPGFHIGTVHRLDTDTSGVMVYAINREAHRNLTRQFEYRLLQKTYLLLTHGQPAWEQTEIERPIGVDPLNRLRYACEGRDARHALTRYQVLSRAKNGDFALLKAFPKTGRTHQIRVHAAALGFPLIGDELYGGRKEDPAFGTLVPRMSLHAFSLDLAHPLSGEPLHLEAPLPEDLRALCAQLGLESELTKAAL